MRPAWTLETATEQQLLALRAVKAAYQTVATAQEAADEAWSAARLAGVPVTALAAATGVSVATYYRNRAR